MTGRDSKISLRRIGQVFAKGKESLTVLDDFNLDVGENEFVSISKGFFQEDGSQRFRDSLSLPKEPEVLAEIAEKIKNI